MIDLYVITFSNCVDCILLFLTPKDCNFLHKKNANDYTTLLTLQYTVKDLPTHSSCLLLAWHRRQASVKIFHSI